MNLEMSLVEYIKAEHQKLLNQYDILFSNAKERNQWDTLIEFCDFEIEKTHHHKEETLIFMTIKDNPLLLGGGPMCTFFFDYYLSQPPLTLVNKLLEKITDTKYEPQWSAELNEIIQKKLPLTIPAEDHEAGKILVRAASDLYARRTDLVILQKNLTQIFQLYRDIQVQHFHKEENCFLPMCQGLLSAEQCTQIIQSFKN